MDAGDACDARAGRIERVAAVVVFAVGMGLFVWQVGYGFAFTLDDPFISFRYARNLVDGHGLVFNPGERVEGYSNLSWTLWAAAGLALGFDPIPWCRWSGIALALLQIVVLFRLARAIFAGLPGARLAAAMTAASLAASFWFALWAVGLLETPLFGLLVVAGTARLLAEERGARPRWAGLLLALSVLTRPDGGLFVLTLLLPFVPAVLRRRPAAAMAFVYAGQVAAVLVPFAAFKLAYYGALLPNTFHAKVSGGDERLDLGLNYLRNFGTMKAGLWGEHSGGHLDLLQFTIAPEWSALLIGIPLALGLVWLAASRALPPRFRTFVVTSVLGYLGFIVYAGGDWMVGFRFFQPLLAVFALLTVAAVLLMLRVALRRPLRIVIGLAVAAVPLLASAAWAERRTAHGEAPWLAGLAWQLHNEPHGPYLDVARWIDGHVPPGRLVALGEAGLIPYYLPRHRVLDFLGLVDPHIAHLDGLLHAKSDAGYVLDRDPDVIVLLGQIDGADRVTWAIPPVLALLAEPRFTQRYRLRHTITRQFVGNDIRDAFLVYGR